MIVDHMEIGAKSIEAERLRAKKWAGTARESDLARELDVCKVTRDSFQSRIGLLGSESNWKSSDSLVSKNAFNQMRIDAIKLEIMKRRTRF
jgi:hypothetical protein